MKLPEKERNEKMLQTVAEALRSRFFDVCVCNDRDEAISQLLEWIAPTDVVSFGGSATIEMLGVVSALKARNQPLVDRNAAKTVEERAQLMRSSLLCDSYLMSANAISADGQLVNIDGNGNRVAALCYGPHQVVIVAGANKIAPDLSSAMLRARTTAAPINATRFDLQTPCRKNGICADCKSADSICAQMVITRICRPAGRIKVLLLPENLGF